MALQVLRPKTVAEAVALLDEGGARTVPMAGGSWLTPRLRTDISVPDSLAESVDSVVDLAELPLRYITLEGEAGTGLLRIGATTTLADLAQDDTCIRLAGGLLAESARRAASTNQRNTATIGGCIVRGDASSELLLALTVLDARIVIAGDDARYPLGERPAGRLISEVQIDWPAQGLHSGMARVARTPADQPIVAAVAVADGAGIRIALGGLLGDPLLIDVDHLAGVEDAVTEKLAGVEVMADFRGSAEYRQAMAPNSGPPRAEIAC